LVEHFIRNEGVPGSSPGVGSTQVETTIREALRRRTPISLSYHRDGGLTRTVHPQVLYVDSGGTLLVDCYQVNGPSSSGGPVPGWRAFELAKIVRLEPGSGECGEAPELNLQSPKYSRLLAHI
jgi:hypothetical protein